MMGLKRVKMQNRVIVLSGYAAGLQSVLKSLSVTTLLHFHGPGSVSV